MFTQSAGDSTPQPPVSQAVVPEPEMPKGKIAETVADAKQMAASMQATMEAKVQKVEQEAA